MDPAIVIPAIIAIAVLYLLMPTLVFGTQAASHPKTVECPETKDFVQVDVDPLICVKRMFADGPQEVVNCSRWPESADCDRACEKCL